MEMFKTIFLSKEKLKESEKIEFHTFVLPLNYCIVCPDVFFSLNSNIRKSLMLFFLPVMCYSVLTFCLYAYTYTSICIAIDSCLLYLNL